MTIYPEFERAARADEGLARRSAGRDRRPRSGERYGWKIGDRIPIQGDDLAPESSGTTWEFNIVGIYDGKRGRSTRPTSSSATTTSTRTGDRAKGWSAGTSSRSHDPSQIARDGADVRRACSRTRRRKRRRRPRKGFVQGFAKQIGDIGAIMIAILAAVLFTILLVAANTMAQAVRERTSELAVLKTLGFSERADPDAGARRVAVHRGRRRRPRAWRWPGSSSSAAIRPAVSCRIFVLPQAGSSVIGVVLCVALGVLAGALPGNRRDAAADHRRAEEKPDVMSWLRQIVAVTPLSLRTIPQRLGSSAVAIVGIAGVVIVLRRGAVDGGGFPRRDAQSPGRRAARSSCAAAPTPR